MMLDGSHLWIVSAGGRESSWIVEDLLRGGPPESVSASGEVVGLFKTGARLGVLAERSVALRGPKWWESTSLKVPLKAGRLTFAATANGLLYVGGDRGEWGGELVVIDLASGASQGLLQENITAVVGDPSSPACVLASSGLAHLSLSEGRAVRACGRDAPKEVFRATKPAKSDWPIPGAWALDDLAPSRRGWSAAADDRLFFSRDSRITETAMPPLRERNGIWINDDDPELLVVLRACCWGSVDDPMDYSVILIPRAGT